MSKINEAISAGIKKCDLYRAASNDIITHEHVEEFFRAALRAYLKELYDEAKE